MSALLAPRLYNNAGEICSIHFADYDTKAT